MIGIDLTRISRFESMKLDRLGERLGQSLDSPRTAAKVWCCLESLIKARGSRLIFNPGQRPNIEDPENVLEGNYTLSLSHEGDLISAVAIKVK